MDLDPLLILIVPCLLKLYWQVSFVHMTALLNYCSFFLHYCDIEFTDRVRSQGELNLLSLIMEFRKTFEKLILVLIGIVGVYVQGTKNPLFETYAANMWSTLLAAVVFCCTGEISCSEFAAVVSGSLVSVSLISALLPVKIGVIIIYITWTFAAFVVVVYRCGRWALNSCLLNKFSLHISHLFQDTDQDSPTEPRRLPVWWRVN